MWTRSDLKSRAKVTFKSSYFKSVIVCLIFFVIMGWQGPYTFIFNVSGGMIGGIGPQPVIDKVISNDLKEMIRYSGNIGQVMSDENVDILFALMPFIFIIILIAIIAVIVGFAINIFIIWPLSVGKFRFFMELREGKDSLDNLLVAYKIDRIKNVFVTFFLKSLYVFLWSILLIIPGIVKRYEYRMIPYILCENPNISSKRAFEISKSMMRGNKWKAFVLDLSFIGWNILGTITAGLLNILYVNPYVESTNAELYAYLREQVLNSGEASRTELLGFTKTI